MSEVDDQVLLDRCQKGDRDAFDALVARHEQRAYRFAYHLTRDPDDAADIVAESFVRVHRALPNFRGGSSFTTWLYRILTNCYLDLRKRDRSRPASSLDSILEGRLSDASGLVESSASGPEEQAFRSAREDTIQAAIRKLPEYQRAMLIMFHVEMLSYEEIADALDLPVGTVKSRLNRARLSLRELLGRNMELFDVTRGQTW
jgi:RNA polymerase sigma-70 factor (ECF subfamily)